MLKEDYFKLALRSGAFKYRNWIISVFTAIVENNYKKVYPYMLTYTDGRVYCINETGLRVEITDAIPGQALIRAHDAITVNPEDAVNLSDTVKSTYGILFANYYMLIYPFGKKIPYINKRFTVKDIENIIVSRFYDDVDDISLELPDRFYVREREILAGANNELSGMNGYLVTNISERSVVGAPNNKEIRDKLVAEHTGDINDPILGAKIDKAIIDNERKYIESDPAGTKFFYTGKKSYEARKRMGGAFGYEAPFTEEQSGRLVLRALDEGIDPNDLPALINGGRSGSDSRANETKIGGGRSKDAFRAFQNHIIEGEFCGTLLGTRRQVIRSDSAILMGMYYQDGLKPTLIDLTEFNKIVNTEVVLKLPNRCRAPVDRTCKVCAGTSLSRNSRSPAIATASAGTGFLIGSLKKMHLASADLSQYNPRLLIS